MGSLQAIQQSIADIVAQHGRLDIAVNAAGVAGGGPVHFLDVDEWNRVLDINLKGTFFVCKHAATQMIAQKSGSIVNIASIEGLEGTEGGSVYNASKGGVIMLTKSMAIDYGANGIRVNAVCPGGVETPLLMSMIDSPGMEPTNCGGSASQRRSPTRSISSAPMRARSLPVRHSSWMAG